MPSPYGMGNSYIPQSQMNGSGGYSQSPMQSPFQTPSQMPMPGPPPQQFSQGMGRTMAGIPSPQGNAAFGPQSTPATASNSPFMGLGSYTSAPTGYQLDPSTVSAQAPWTQGGGNSQGATLLNWNSTPSTYTNGFGNWGPLQYNPALANPQGGSAVPGYGMDYLTFGPNSGGGMQDYLSLSSMSQAGQAPQGFTQNLPGQGNSWGQFSQGMGGYMNNLNAWNNQYGGSANNVLGQGYLNGLAAQNPYFQNAANSLNYNTLFSNAQGDYNSIYNQYANNGQFGIPTQNPATPVGGR